MYTHKHTVTLLVGHFPFIHFLIPGTFGHLSFKLQWTRLYILSKHVNHVSLYKT